MSWDALGAHLALLALRCDGGLLRDTLDPIGKAISATEQSIEETTKSADPKDVDVFVDDGCELIENLLGAAFIVCQTRITAVVSAGVQLAKYCAGKNIPFTAFAPQKDTILSTGAAPLGAGITKIQFMDAAANYFKHRDEWVAVDWSKLTGLSKRTADTIQIGGLSPGSTGNLRAAAQALGNPDFHEMHVFTDILDGWSEDVLARAKKALGK